MRVPVVRDEATPRAAQGQPPSTATHTASPSETATSTEVISATPASTKVASATPASTEAVSATPTPTEVVSATPDPRNTDDLPIIAYDELPREARETIRLIERGGPFPYRQDGSTFQNRERLLPRKPGGYYQEYTVKTPGEDDRGARRIVAGREGELYYTDDHYASFRRVLR